MALFDKIFKRTDSPKSAPAQTSASSAGNKKRLSLQIVYPVLPPLNAETLTKKMRAFDAAMAQGSVDIAEGSVEKGTPFGQLRWGPHVVELVGFDAPMPPQTASLCVAPAHYGQDLKQAALAHRAHLLLYYAGQSQSPVEQYTALAAAAGVLSEQAIVVMNETARASVPAALLAAEDQPEGRLAMLGGLPPPLLYCGFVKYNTAQQGPVWMRTHGANAMGLPEFGMWTPGHHEGEATFNTFASLLDYLLESKAVLEPGHTMQMGQRYLKFRAPASSEPQIVPGERLLVVETITADRIKRF